MILTMKRHAARTDSSVPQFKRRVPLDVVSRVKGRLVTFALPAVGREPETVVTLKLGEFAKVSLRTKNLDAAKVRAIALASHLETLWEAVRQGPAPVSQRNLDEMAREVYLALMSEHGDNPGTPERWEAFKALTRAALEGRIAGAPPIRANGQSDDAVAAEMLFGGFTGSDLTEWINAMDANQGDEALVQRVGRLTFWTLDRRGITVDSAVQVDLMRRVARAALDAAWALKRRAGGDWRPDPAAERFPVPETKAKAPGLTLTQVFERWRAEAKPSPSTVSTWQGVVKDLKSYLKHEDVARITESDVVGWKDALIARGIKPGTVNNGFLAGLKALLNYAKRNNLIRSNPAEGIRVAVKVKAGERMLAYSDEDVARLLACASREIAPAKRWLPMLAALTGARIGELAALWGTSVIEREGVVGINIAPSPDGATLKNAGSERFVPLHPEIVRAGFVEYARTKGHNPLFYGKPARRGSEAKHPSKGTTNHLSTWIRGQGFDNERIAPAHGLRHFWKSAASRAGIADSIADAIQGHSDDRAAARYRHISIAQMNEAMERFPVPALPSQVPAMDAMPATPAPAG
ncbi:tyrosine-type recombinase/integrase [Methylorubrum thiocyanatum]|uniref:Integrase n=1 Tax=Methylorubrum thiocyanatum TaxID=47958 RepID=A0AA40S7S6_9HYPH|nr:tyrosine-type recombinase/integrase [Methylorubrum thiocyanatum]MBA8916014.1 integrase [Methylorubrum thiocyanatum]GJE80902.1 Tyrosine recombinase XerC [Methylorubrum thiocyanatum]